MDIMGAVVTAIFCLTVFSIGFTCGWVFRDYTIYEEVLLKRECVNGKSR